MIMQSTNVKLPNAPTVLPIIEISKFNVGHDLANLNTRSCINNNKVINYIIILVDINNIYLYIFTNLNERKTDRPCTPSRPSSTSDNATIIKSNIFHPT